MIKIIDASKCEVAGCRMSRMSWSRWCAQHARVEGEAVEDRARRKRRMVR